MPEFSPENRPEIPPASGPNPWSDSATLSWRRPSWAAMIETVALCLLVLYLLFFILHAVRVLPFPHDVDNGEGFLLWQATLYSEGRLPYLPIDEPPFMVSNYPPLYPLFISVFLPWTGPTLAIGRWISFLCSLAVAGGLGWMVYRQSQQWKSGMIAGLLFVGSYHVYLWGVFHRVDLLALLFSLLALSACVSRRHWAWVLACCTLALCVRQTTLAAPLAIGCFWLSRREYRKTALFWGGLVLLIGSITVLLNSLTDGEYFRHIVVYNRNRFIWETVFFYFLHLWKFYALLSVLGLFYFFQSVEKRNFDLAFWFLLFSFLASLLCGKVGSAPNYFLELMLALSWIFGLVRARIRSMEPTERQRFHLVFACMLLLQVLAPFHYTHFPPFLNHPRYSFSWTPTPEDYRQEEVLGYLIRREEGPVLIEDAGMALVHGKSVYYQPFILTQLENQELWDPDPLLRMIRKQEFDLIVLREDIRNTPEQGTDRISKVMADTMKERYVIDKILSGRRTFFLLRPRRN